MSVSMLVSFFFHYSLGSLKRAVSSPWSSMKKCCRSLLLWYLFDKTSSKASRQDTGSIETWTSGKFRQICLASAAAPRLILCQLPATHFKISFLQFSILLFSAPTWNSSERKVENTLPLIFHFSKSIFYFCMKKSLIEQITSKQTTVSSIKREIFFFHF